MTTFTYIYVFTSSGIYNCVTSIGFESTGISYSF